MSSVSLGLVQMNPILADIKQNCARIEEYAQAAGSLPQILVFPELTLTGYPPEDLLFRRDFLQAAQVGLESLQQASLAWPDVVVVVGAPLVLEGKLYNCAVALHHGQLLAVHRKRHLPNYEVFDEQRYFHSSEGPTGVFEWRQCRFALSVCEDIWFEPVMDSAVSQRAQVVLSINASPFHRAKQHRRFAVLQERLVKASSATPMILVYVNQIGGQDELVFDGGSMVVSDKQVLSMPRFEQGVAFVELHPETGALAPKYVTSFPLKLQLQALQDSHDWLDPLQEVFHALVLGTRDYVQKNGFAKVMLGLSGGIDSALTLAIAVAAVGADKVHAVMMPFAYTSQMSVEDAEFQAKALGVHFSVMPIGGIYTEVCQALAGTFADAELDTTHENIQARSRGLLLMALSNKYHGLVLTTGNKSELAVGYSTLYGDMAGGFNPIKDVPKTEVYELANYINQHAQKLGFQTQVIPDRVIERPASAELRPDQTDQDTLPEYSVLDEILRRFIELDESAETIIADGFDKAQVLDTIRRVKLNEHKRRQAPPGVRLSRKAFGRDRRYPITARW